LGKAILEPAIKAETSVTIAKVFYTEFVSKFYD